MPLLHCNARLYEGDTLSISHNGKSIHFTKAKTACRGALSAQHLVNILHKTKFWRLESVENSGV